MRTTVVYGFSHLGEKEKREFIARYAADPAEAGRIMEEFILRDPAERSRFMEFSENTVSSFHTPYGIAPNVMVDDCVYHVPMATEESSVIAAASNSARFWAEQGGFRVTHRTMVKPGEVWFRWFCDPASLREQWPMLRRYLLERLRKITSNMDRRGGGIRTLDLIDKTSSSAHLFQIFLEVDTVDSMGANLINTCLEEIAEGLPQFFGLDGDPHGRCLQVIMAILSNYTPQCTVTVGSACHIRRLASISNGMEPAQFAEKLVMAFRIAELEVSRAVTHNKGIMNGIDAVLTATGNDHRAVEAAAHAYASRQGRYSSLSWCHTRDDMLTLGLTMPLALGTVGGITQLHPLARLSLEILGNPTAGDLMGIVAAVGLASNFAAVRSLVTIGIQQGHMRLHLSNLLNLYQASPVQREQAFAHFRNRKVTHAALKQFLTVGSHEIQS